jgi:hypothetical protein
MASGMDGTRRALWAGESAGGLPSGSCSTRRRVHSPLDPRMRPGSGRCRSRPGPRRATAGRRTSAGGALRSTALPPIPRRLSQHQR